MGVLVVSGGSIGVTGSCNGVATGELPSCTSSSGTKLSTSCGVAFGHTRISCISEKMQLSFLTWSSHGLDTHNRMCKKIVTYCHLRVVSPDRVEIGHHARKCGRIGGLPEAQ
jgi:hypothetical protein